MASAPKEFTPYLHFQGILEGWIRLYESQTKYCPSSIDAFNALSGIHSIGVTADCEMIEQLGSRCSSGMCLFVAYTNAKYTGLICLLRTFDEKNSLHRFGDVSSMTTPHHFYARKGGGEGM